MQSFPKSLSRARNVVQKAGSWIPNPAGSVSILTSFWGQKGASLCSVLRRKCLWVWWCLPDAQKPDGFLGRALTQLSCSLFSRFLIYYSMTPTWLPTKAGSALQLGLKYLWSLKKKGLKWHLKSEAQQDNLSFHTHWAGLARISLIANKLSNTLATSTVGCWTQHLKARHLNCVIFTLKTLLLEFLNRFPRIICSLWNIANTEKKKKKLRYHFFFVFNDIQFFPAVRMNGSYCKAWLYPFSSC